MRKLELEKKNKNISTPLDGDVDDYGTAWFEEVEGGERHFFTSTGSVVDTSSGIMKRNIIGG